MKKLKTWQLVLLIIFYPVGIVYFIIWLINRNKAGEQAPTSQSVSAAARSVVSNFHTKVVGVTFNNDDGSSRQEAIKCCKEGDDIIFKPMPTAEYPDAIGVFTMKGKQLGHLSQGVAAEIKNKYGHNPMSVTVVGVTGGGEYTYGCNLHIIVYEI